MVGDAEAVAVGVGAAEGVSVGSGVSVGAFVAVSSGAAVAVASGVVFVFSSEPEGFFLFAFRLVPPKKVVALSPERPTDLPATSSGIVKMATTTRKAATPEMIATRQRRPVERWTVTGGCSGDWLRGCSKRLRLRAQPGDAVDGTGERLLDQGDDDRGEGGANRVPPSHTCEVT